MSPATNLPETMSSGGVPETKDLLDHYMHLRFLELADDPRLAARYRR